MRRAFVVAMMAVALAACGDEEGGGAPAERSESPSLAPTAEPTSTSTAEGDPPTATVPRAPTPPPDATGPEEEPGGAGDEEAVRTRVRVVVDGEGITPPRVEIPAFLALRITVRNDLPRRVRVALRGAHRAVRIPARSTRSFDVDGLQRGEYAIDAGGAGRGTLVAG